MNLSDALKNLKEFFLEFLGYFLPGFTFIFLLCILFKEDVIHSFYQSIQNSGIDTNFAFVFLSYILGYIIYGINIYTNELIENIGKWLPFLKKHIGISKNEIIKKIMESFEYNATKEIVNNKFGKDSIDLGFSGYRNYAMSVIGGDKVQTIYTFMFRADLCSHLMIICRIIGSLGLISSLLFLFNCENDYINNSKGHTILFITLIFVSFFLKKTSTRFLSIALRICFPMFLSKIYFDK